MKQLLLSLSMLAIVCAGCEQSEKAAEATGPAAETFDLAAAKESIAANNVSFGKALAAGDSVGLAALYTSDGILMPANMPNFVGTAAITSFFNEGIRGGLKNIKLESTEVYGNSEMLEEVGVYTFTDDNGVTFDKGKYIILWKKDGDKWKIFRDIFNSDNPPPPPPPPAPPKKK